MSLRRSLSLLAVLLPALAACAGGDPPDHGGFGGREHGGGPQARLPNVFISPAGEPFRAARGEPYPVAVWFQRADTNHDGRLSREEFRADALSFFNRLDTNHDGVMDGLELQDYEQTIAPEILPHIESLHAEEGMDTSLTFGDQNNADNRQDRRERRPSGLDGGRAPTVRGVGTQGAAVYSLIDIPEPVAAADTQFDGRITRAEFAAAADHRFDLLDKKSVGYLTLATLPKTPVQAAILKREKAERKKGRHPGADEPASP